MSELLKLAERLEQATGPDRELDEIIALSAGFTRQSVDSTCGPYEAWICPKRVSAYRYCPCFTASLDAAMTLAENSGYAGLLLEIAKNAIAERFAHECLSADDYRTALARALCAASLRALAAQEPSS